MKVKLNCVYGDNPPNTIVELKKELAEKMIAEGNATDAKGDVSKSSKELLSLKTKVEALELQVKTLTDDKKALELQVKTLTPKKE